MDNLKENQVLFRIGSENRKRFVEKIVFVKYVDKDKHGVRGD